MKISFTYLLQRRNRIRLRLQQEEASMLQQLCNDASDTVLIEKNRLQSHSGDQWSQRDTLWWSDSIVFNDNDNRIASVIAEFCRSVYADAWCKWTLKKYYLWLIFNWSWLTHTVCDL